MRQIEQQSRYHPYYQSIENHEFFTQLLLGSANTRHSKNFLRAKISTGPIIITSGFIPPCYLFFKDMRPFHAHTRIWTYALSSHTRVLAPDDREHHFDAAERKNTLLDAFWQADEISQALAFGSEASLAPRSGFLCHHSNCRISLPR